MHPRVFCLGLMILLACVALPPSGVAHAQPEPLRLVKPSLLDDEGFDATDRAMLRAGSAPYHRRVAVKNDRDLSGALGRAGFWGSILMAGALAGTEGTSLTRPAFIALGAGAATSVALAAWAASQGADTGAVLLGVMGAMVVTPLAFLVAGSVELAMRTAES